ncbi:unnamed protein product [Ophioblennius macclurei]
MTRSLKGQATMLLWVLLALFLTSYANDRGKVDRTMKTDKTRSQFSRGWGQNIRWLENYTAGLQAVTKTHKPLMVIHHLDRCPYCQALKKAFAADKTIQKMARESFLMLNVLEETDDKNLAPDGYYVPRILFVDAELRVRNDITGNYSNRLYTYTPNDMKLLAENMRKVKALVHNEL